RAATVRRLGARSLHAPREAIAGNDRRERPVSRTTLHVPYGRAPMVIETRHLQMVVAIAEQSSLTKASAQLHLSQPALSQQLSTLEKRLGAPLFHRAGKRMIPTAIGLRVLDSARSMVREVADVEADVKRLATGKDRLLRLATQCYTAYHWLPGVLTRY